MTAPDLSPLIGTVLIDDVRVVSVVRQDDAIALLHARRDSDGSPCVVRVATAVELRESDAELVRSAVARVSRYIVGIRALAPPIGAGAVQVGSARRLFIVHRGEASSTAADRIASGPAMPLREVVRVLQPLAEALRVLHDQGLVHGAVIPSAVHLGASGPTLSLFGWSEIGAVIAGPMAARDLLPPRDRTPEQVAIVPAAPTAASDTYGLAMLAAQLLAGKVFCESEGPAEAAHAIDNSMLRPTPRALGADVPDAVEAVFAKALATQPRERTADPKAFVAALAAPPEAAGLGATKAAAPSPIPHPVPVPEPEPAPVPEHEHDQEHEPERGAPPPQPQRPPSFFKPPPVPPPPASSAWMVYVLIGLGVLLLFGGAGAGFYLALTRPPAPPAATTATSPVPPPVLPGPATPPRITVPGPTDDFPDAGEDEDEDDSGAVDDDDQAEPGDAAAPGAHLWTMRPDAGALTTWPEDATALIPIGEHTPVIGTRDALVTIVLFADLECPYTRKARRLIERLVYEQGSNVRVAVRLLPMPSNAGSDEAARVGAATALTTDAYSFWHLFELVSEQGRTGPTDRDGLLGLAEKAGAARPLLDRKILDRTVDLLLDDDRVLAGRLMVHATPTWFINGRRLNGLMPWTKLDSEVGREIVAAKGMLHSGVTQPKLYTARVLYNVTSAGADREAPDEE